MWQEPLLRNITFKYVPSFDSKVVKLFFFLAFFFFFFHDAPSASLRSSIYFQKSDTGCHFGPALGIYRMWRGGWINKDAPRVWVTLPPQRNRLLAGAISAPTEPEPIQVEKTECQKQWKDMVLHPAAWAEVAAERKPLRPQLGIFADTVTVLLFPNADSLV